MAYDAFALGLHYQTVEKDNEKMIKYYLEAANKGDTNAMCNLALYYKNKNPSQSVAYYEMAADLGDDAALLELASYHKTRKNNILTKKYYRLAADTGNPLAMHELATYYKNVEKSIGLMKKYYGLAIGLGHIPSMREMAMYYKKSGDTDMMYTYLLMAWQSGDRGGAYELGRRFSSDAISYYTVAVENGDYRPLPELMTHYENVRDYPLMKKYCLLAVEKYGNKYMYEMGRYHSCVGEYDKMKKCYLLAGSSDAMFELANCYQAEGKYEKMKRYYELAIEKGGHVGAMMRLGYFYNYVKLDYGKMKKYYLMAIGKGDIGAMMRLGHYYEYVERNYERMKEYYCMAAGKGDDMGAMYALGTYYERVEGDCVAMRKWYLMAIERGHPEQAIMRESIKKFEWEYVIEGIRRGNGLRELFGCYEKNDIENECLICRSNKECMLNLKCNKVYNHFYCTDCFRQWYRVNAKKCIVCFCAIDLGQVTLSL